MKDTRDNRDPESLGKMILLEAKEKGLRVSQAADLAYAGRLGWVPAYKGGPYMSADPAEHHSKTPQSVDLQSENPDA